MRATTRVIVVWLARCLRVVSALRAAVSSGVSGLPSSATTRGCFFCAISRAPLSLGARGAGGVEPRPGADQPLLAALGQGLAPLPQREGLLEGRRTLLELRDD